MSVRGAIVNGFHATIPGRRLHRDNCAVRRRDGLVDVDFTRSRSTTIGLPIKRRFKGESSNEYALFYFPVPFASPRVPSLKGRRPDDLNQRQLLPSGRQELHLQSNGHKSLDYDETHLRSRLRSYVLSVFFSLEPVHFG